MNGGDGDDTIVWNNGDGNDVMNGDGGIDRIETNLCAADDVSTLKIENGRVRYDRTNAGPFNLSIGTAEFFELNTLGGDDTLTTRRACRSRSSPTPARATTHQRPRQRRERRPCSGGSGTDKVIADARRPVAADVETRLDRASRSRSRAARSGPGARDRGQDRQGQEAASRP